MLVKADRNVVINISLSEKEARWLGDLIVYFPKECGEEDIESMEMRETLFNNLRDELKSVTGKDW